MKKCSNLPIFVVDDDQGILESFEVMLGDEYFLVMVNNGTEAVEMLNKQKPPLLFLDIKLPGINGLKILEKIRANGLDTVVVIISSLYRDYDNEVATKYGVYRYLCKPFDVKEVEDIVNSVIPFVAANKCDPLPILCK